jgi:hypothetical protein
MKVILWQQWIGTVSPHPEATLNLLEMALVLRDYPQRRDCDERHRWHVSAMSLAMIETQRITAVVFPARESEDESTGGGFHARARLSTSTFWGGTVTKRAFWIQKQLL